MELEISPNDGWNIKQTKMVVELKNVAKRQWSQIATEQKVGLKIRPNDVISGLC